MTNKRILLVEDNPSDVQLTLRAFERERITNVIDVVTDGQEALDYLFGTGSYRDRAGNELPTLVLMDLKLPKLSGIEVLREIRADARTRRLPVVILTSSSDEKDVIDSYDSGVNSYVNKPIDFREFSEAIRQLNLYWLVLNAPPPLG